jgi:hypothetical protein
LPMMTEDALDDLAADIKTHGQKVAILVDVNGVLFDGRNRLEACRRADIEARIEVIETPVDPEAFVASLNAKRRDLTASTRALAAARAWKRAVADGRVQPHGGDRKKSSGESRHLIADPRRRFSELFGANKDYTQQAYALVTRDPTGAEAVAKGQHVKTAYEALVEHEAESNSENAKRARLEAYAPDLLELVNDGRMTLGEALAALHERQHREEQIRAGGRRAAADLKLACAQAACVRAAIELGERDLIDAEALKGIVDCLDGLLRLISGVET